MRSKVGQLLQHLSHMTIKVRRVAVVEKLTLNWHQAETETLSGYTHNPLRPTQKHMLRHGDTIGPQKKEEKNSGCTGEPLCLNKSPHADVFLAIDRKHFTLYSNSMWL